MEAAAATRLRFRSGLSRGSIEPNLRRPDGRRSRISKSSSFREQHEERNENPASAGAARMSSRKTTSGNRPTLARKQADDPANVLMTRKFTRRIAADCTKTEAGATQIPDGSR
jgi:hypothetical protein